MEAAPFHDDVADAPPGTTARRVETSDGLRIRVAISRPTDAARGTVLLFPGRTEYAEKYGRVARFFTDAGFAVLVIDWRGQGLSDRTLADPRLGHVDDFAEYQRDVAAALNCAEQQALPGPYFLLAHSMGGCIGLRALLEGLPVRAAAFSAPMWGINLSPAEVPIAWASSLSAPLFGKSHRLVPQTEPDHLVATGPFEGNDLTTDRAMWDYMKAQINAHPELALGGPTLGWLRAALLETTRLARRRAPNIPALTWLGTNERVVSPRAIRRRMARWSDGQLVRAERAEHEIMMERPEIRQGFLSAARTLFLAQI